MVLENMAKDRVKTKKISLLQIEFSKVNFGSTTLRPFVNF